VVDNGGGVLADAWIHTDMWVAGWKSVIDQ
jgi:hypothetical protein